MTLDTIAKRYGTLPSRIMQQGDSLDMYCANLALGYEDFLRNKDDPKTMTKQFSQEELQGMVARVKGKNERTGNEE